MAGGLRCIDMACDPFINYIIKVIEYGREVKPCDPGPISPTGEEFKEHIFFLPDGETSKKFHHRLAMTLVKNLESLFGHRKNNLYWRVKPIAEHQPDIGQYQIYMRLLLTNKSEAGS